MNRELVNQINQNQELTLDSREVSEMIGKEHSKLLRDIRTYCKYLNEAKIGLVDYFAESSYTDSKGEKRPCFSLTKMGCEMVANKLTGKKGVLFTAKYVKKFNEMEQAMNNNIVPFANGEIMQQTLQLAQGMQLIGQVVQGIQESITNVQEFVKDSINSKDAQIEEAMDLIGIRAKNVKMLTEHLKYKLSSILGVKITATNLIYIKTKNKIFREFKVLRWEDIPTNKFNSVFSYIDTLEDEEFLKIS